MSSGAAAAGAGETLRPCGPRCAIGVVASALAIRAGTPIGLSDALQASAAYYKGSCDMCVAAAMWVAAEHSTKFRVVPAGSATSIE